MVKQYTPHILLRDFVNCIMIIDVQLSPDSPPVICPYPPAPQDSLFFYLDDRISVKKMSDENFVQQSRSVIVGTQLESVSIDIKKRHRAVRVGFQPGGMHRLLGLTMRELIDGHLDAEDVFGREMTRLNERLQECPSFDAIHHCIETFLIARANRLKAPLPFDKAILELVSLGGNRSIDRVASDACVSVRQLERLSIERIGMSPKMFARLTRFSKAYRLRERDVALTWTDIAYRCGYYDQMHFIKDFKFFAGVTPSIMEDTLQNTSVRLQKDLRL